MTVKSSIVAALQRKLALGTTRIRRGAGFLSVSKPHGLRVTASQTEYNQGTMSAGTPISDLPAEELERRKRTRIVKRVTSRKEQDRENMLYWRRTSSAERLRACFELTRSAYLSKGYDAESLERSDRSVTRLQRAAR